ncbi:acyltransferase family protein [Paracoccus aerodenitrificans]|uniref:acyltransferase family protein n=1 Tax=Paracoccus aerodenitrificans TaxID=3017781 RepID=UPI0022F07EA1|nr:acyltransferase [Paracoccus aerodenitrificans]WBU64619.1 acyltransferase [Paracoccus aerodenitrificans]
MPANSQSGTPHLVSIQLLRTIAATAVVFEHAQQEATQSTASFLRIEFDFGIGVDIFFIISGFVMWLSSSHLFGISGGPPTFLKKRFQRVVPLYWLYTLAMLAAIIMLPGRLNNSETSPLMVLSSFLFFPYPNTLGDYTPVLALGWTLNYEIFFYALFGISLFFVRKQGFAVLCALIFGFVLIWSFTNGGPIQFWGRPIILEFLIGVCLARIYMSRGSRPSHQGFAILILAAFVACWLLDFSSSRLIRLGIASSLFSVAFIFFLPPRLSGSLSGIARWGGDSSYTLYLSHPFVLAIVKIIWRKLDEAGTHPWLYVWAATIICVFACYALYLLIERPLLKIWKRKPIARTA